MTRVSPFIKNNSNKWNQELLETVVPKSTAAKICTIPLSKSGGKDRVVWHYSRDGVYNVKSGYWMQCSLNKRDDPCSSFSIDRYGWNKVWNAKTAPRVQHFFWKALSNALATKENLFKRHCGQSPICPICYESPESIEHLLLQCAWTRPVWFGCPISLRININSGTTLAQWFMKIIEANVANNTVETIMNVCWHIWKARNEMVFENSRPNPESVILRSNGLYKDYIENCFQTNGDETTVMAKDVHKKWKKPPESYLKINVDASIKCPSEVVGIGIIVRNDLGQLIDVWGKRDVASSPIIAEALALRSACIRAKENNWTKVVFQSDNLEIVTLCTNAVVTIHWEIEAIIEDVRAMRVNFDWSFIWEHRSSNIAANCLAIFTRESVESHSVFVWPDQLWSCIASDSS